MSLAASVLGYAGLGLFARCYALGIQKRNIFDNLGGHAMAMAGFGAVGYYFHGLEDRQQELIAKKKAEILKHREEREQRLSAKADDE